MTGLHFHITLIRQEESAAVMLNGRRSIYTIVREGIFYDMFRVVINGEQCWALYNTESDAAIACAKLAQSYFRKNRRFPYAD